MSTTFDVQRYLIPFRTGLLPQIFCNTLVLGSGVAGLRAAIAAAPAGDVIVCTKDRIDKTNTAWAQGGIAAVLRDDDTIDAHIEDTLVAGAGLCDEHAVDLVCRQGPSRVRELIDWGVGFDECGDHLCVGREGGHNAARIYHAGGDATGRAIQDTLQRRARMDDSIRVFDHCFVIDLLTPSDHEGAPVLGAITWHARYGLQVVWARTTIVASGGAGQIYRETSNPRIATGDGVALAHRAGARLADMEFVQFHPTTLYVPGAPRALISEAMRGEGAHLLDDHGARFMVDEHELAELAPRDVVSRAIVKQLARSGATHVWLDCTHIDGLKERFPGICAMLASFGFDPSTDRIPVHPAAHYTIGGIETDLHARSSVPNLYAIGEASCTGLNGANRLASNSLLEGLVMGAIAGTQARERAAQGPQTPVPIVSSIAPSTHAELDLGDVRSSLRSTMWYNAGIVRTTTRLRDALDMFEIWGRYTLDKVFETPEGWEVQNMLLVARLVTRAAHARPRSVGTHRLRGEDPDAAPTPRQSWSRFSEHPAPITREPSQSARVSDA